MSDSAFDDHEAAQLARWAQLSYAQRLAWLWDAKLFADKAIRAARLRDERANGHPCDERIAEP